MRTKKVQPKIKEKDTMRLVTDIRQCVNCKQAKLLIRDFHKAGFKKSIQHYRYDCKECVNTPIEKDPLKRLLNKVTKDSLTGCWVFNGCRNHGGYGAIGLNGTTVKAHNFVYESLVSKIPSNLELDHLCRNRACVNPAHLEPVTHLENVRRGDSGKYLRDKNSCKRGHPFSGENLINYKGRRKCKVCDRTAAREYQRRKRSRSGHYENGAGLAVSP